MIALVFVLGVFVGVFGSIVCECICMMSKDADDENSQNNTKNE